MRTSLSPELDPGMESQVANSLAPLKKSNYFITNHLLMVILNKYESQLSN
jgi:hypothetical protein